MHRVRNGALFVGMLSVLFTACGGSVRRVGREGPRAPSHATVSPEQTELALRATYVATRQEEGRLDPSFHVHPDREALVTTATSGIGTAFTSSGVHVRGAAAAWSMTMRTSHLTCGDRRLGVREARPESTSDAPHRVAYERPSFTEWYVNGPLGLEQGYTLATNPCRAGERLGIEVTFEGLAPHVERAGTLALRDDEGVVRLAYGDLYASDAGGRAIDATLALDGAVARLSIDPRGARFPVVIDPLVVLPETTFMPVGSGDGGPYHKMGNSVAIDGDTAVIGTADFSGGHFARQGAVYVFVRDGTTWTRQARIDSPDTSHAGFGTDVSISGDTIAIGAPERAGESSAGAGSVYVFVRTGTAWAQQTRIVRGSGSPDDAFGSSVDIDADTIVVGARADSGDGAAYVYVRSGGVWGIEARLTDSWGGTPSYFGTSVAVHGDRIAIGAPWGDVGAIVSPGTVEVFARSMGVWAFQQRISAPDLAGGDSFGASVDIDNTTLIVGAPLANVAALQDVGAAHVFTRAPMATVWTHQQKLDAGVGGSASDYFGTSVALSGDTAVVGSPEDDSGGILNRGAALVFTRSSSTWTRVAKRFASNGVGGENHGTDVAIDQASVLVGTPLWKNGKHVDQGNAFVYVGGAWNEQARMWAGTGVTGSNFGVAIDVSGDTAIVTAPMQEPPAAYVFVRDNDGAWTLQQKLTDENGNSNDFFGAAAAIDGDTIAVSSPFAAGAVPFAGAVLVFTRTGTTWTRQARLEGHTGSEFFGMSIALSGKDLVIGAPWADDNGRVNVGKVYFYERFGELWDYNVSTSLMAGLANDELGVSVAVAQDIAVIGAPTAKVDGVKTGAAYVFVLEAGSWRQKARLVLDGGVADDKFGTTVAVTVEPAGTTIYVGAPGVMGGRGVVARYTGALETWTAQPPIVASTRAMGDNFGSTLTVSDRFLVIGAPEANMRRGEISIFLKGTEGSWLEQTRLASATSALARFAIDGTRLIVGSHTEPGDTYEEGRAFLYRLNGFAGDSCASETQCMQGLLCVAATCCAPGTCPMGVPDGGVDADASVDTDAGPNVDAGTRAQPATGLCTASPSRDASRSPLMLGIALLGALLVRKRRRFLRGATLAALLVTLLATSHVAAQTTEAVPPADQNPEAIARAQFQLGQALYEEGRFLEAARAFEAAYAASPRSQLLYNTYLAYQNGQDLDNAADALRRYIASDATRDTPSFRRRLEAIEAQIAERNAARARDGETTTTTTTTPETQSASVVEADAPRSRRGRRIAGVSLLVGGGVVAVTGFLAGSLVLASEQDRLDGHCGPSAGLPAGTCLDDDVVRDVAGRTSGMRALAWGSLGVGVATATVGVVLLLTGGDEEASTSTLAPALACTREGCVGGVMGSF